jgi:superoxide reductase
MSEPVTLYRCPVCQTLVEILHPCSPELLCCGREMQALPEQPAEDAPEHRPTIQRLDGGVLVTVGRGRHASSDEHHISWIELICDGASSRQFLRPGQPAQAWFSAAGDELAARAYCSLHGLWATQRQQAPREATLWPELLMA